MIRQYGRNSGIISHVSTGAAIAPAIEPGDTLLVMMTARRTIPRHPNPSPGCRAASAPNAVATPFPPWNFMAIGKTWPRKTARHAIIAACSPSRCPHRRTMNVPFSISTSRTIRAACFPMTLRVLVVPGLPLPSFLMSMPFAFPMIVDGDMLPTR